MFRVNEELESLFFVVYSRKLEFKLYFLKYDLFKCCMFGKTKVICLTSVI